MDKKLQSPAAWINSRYHPEAPEPEEPEFSEDVIDEIIRLQDQADDAMCLVILLSGIILTAMAIIYIMWANNLIIFIH
ncbi:MULTISPECIES: hypothetical protein [unclassified Megasphaera]|uniref:hypothetical protein n=1 Tax=unclassified Megasphaera TaxID=2626256 RepID=UPI0025C6E012|nr:hypothetical protein [Megasphaera sp. UBA4233]